MIDKEVSVLCIDDEESIRFALEAVMESQGWIAYTAKNVKEGLEIYKAKRPTLVLMDYHMPVINGITGVSMLRELDSNVPIIVFTIDANQDLADRFIEIGATDFANKPIKAPDLISRMKLHIRLLEKHEALTAKGIIAQSEKNTKGIREATLSLILDSLYENNEHLMVEEISELTGLSYQTTYRYLQFLESEGIVQVKITYGKIGRPKQSYTLIQKI